MTSILTNVAAMSALSTLRSIDASMAATQGRVSSGYRVEKASDNAAYWSIATTMRSDRKALSTVNDALGLGAATTGTAYSGMSAVIDLLSEVKAKLVAASEPGVDKGKIQKEIEQLKKQVVSTATSASFAGQNWLNTDIADIRDATKNTTSVPASFTRDASGGVAVNSIGVDLSAVSLFNTSGFGLLQRNMAAPPAPTTPDPFLIGNSVNELFHFNGPVTLSASDSINFNVVIHRGGGGSDLTLPTTITRSDVDAALGVSTGTISNGDEMTTVLTHAWAGNTFDLSATPLGVTPVNGTTNWHSFYVSASRVSLDTDTSIRFTNLVSTLPGGAAGGLEGASYQTSRSHLPTNTPADPNDLGGNLYTDFVDIDVTNGVGDQLAAVEEMLRRTTIAGATLGSVQMRIDMQSSFVQDLIDTIGQGVGRLVDAEMDEESTRLKALQTQQQLGIQSLQIANSNAANIMALFR